MKIRPRGLRVFLWGILAAAALVFLTYAILTPVASARKERAEKRWAEAGMPIVGLEKAYPAQGDSPAALELEACAVRLGLSLRSTDPESKAVSPEAAAAWKVARGGVTACIEELKNAEVSPLEPPGTVTEFLANHAATLQEIRQRLGAGQIRWRMDVSKGYEAEIPNLLGHLDLARLFAASALVEHAAGRDAKAVEDVQAAWDLSSAIEPRPELISQLVCIAMRKMAAATLRRMEGVPAPWDARLASWEPERGLLRSYAAEAAAMRILWEAPSLRAIGGGSPGGRFDRAVTFLARPYFRLCLADTQSLFLDTVEAEKALGACASDVDLLAARSPSRAKIPRWNFFAAIALPDLSSYGRAKHYRIQAELTRKVLALKAARDASGSWPSPTPDVGASFCPKEHWEYEVGADGSMSLRFTGAPPAKEYARGGYPQEYREAPKMGRAAAR